MTNSHPAERAIGQTQDYRKLAAIMFTDLVGYSALTQKNEALALELLEEHRRMLRGVFPSFDGREIETAGDAFFVEFASALQATRCAIEIQKMLHERNLPVAEERRLRLRIGLHVGDVVVRGPNILGDGVNIAARIEPLAQPGGICISEDVARQVRNKIDFPLRKLGTTGLKNIRLAVEIYAVDLPWLDKQSEFEKLRPELVLNNLPVQGTHFVGREKEQEALRQLLLREPVRLVTLTGPGGTGKTRLALQVAGTLLDQFQNGACFVTLAPVSDPGLILAELAKTLGVRDSPARPLIENIKEFLRDLNLLLLIDNFEQVLTAAPVVADLLASSPALKILVTSREPLHVSAEHEFLVPPLNLPDLRKLPTIDSLSQYGAVELFIERAVAVKPDFTVTNENAPAVAELCHRLDGLPLAIELAAARIKLLSPQAILARLGNRFDLLRGEMRDKPARHQTLRQAIAWSHDLLGPDERALFRRLAVFTGGCSLETAEAICNARGDLAHPAFDGIAALVDKSLLRQDQSADGQPRFVMLETIREFALEILRQSGEFEAVSRTHADFFITLAEKAEKHLTGPDQKAWLDLLEGEHDNFRSVFQWLEESGDIEEAFRMGAGLWRFWVVRGYMREGRDRLMRLLTLPNASGRSVGRARVLNAVGTILHETGEYRAARPLLEESLDISREVNDKKGIGTVLNNLSVVEGLMGDLAKSRALSEESIVLHKDLGDKRGIALALHNIGWIARAQLDFASQISLIQQSLELRKEIGDERGVAYMMINIAWAERFRGNYEKATQLAEEGLAMLRRIGDKQISGWALSILSDIARDTGDLDRSATLLREGMALVEEAGNKFAVSQGELTMGIISLKKGELAIAKESFTRGLKSVNEMERAWGVTEMLCHRGLLALAEENAGEAVSYFDDSLTRSKPVGDKLAVAFALECHAQVCVLRKEYDRAAVMLGAAASFRLSIGAPVPPIDRPSHDGLLAAVRSALGDARFEELWSNGESMSVDRAVDFALEGNRG